jgi:quercetin dioxygenase-like cupin family protein
MIWFWGRREVEMAYRVVNANEIEASHGVFRGLSGPLGVSAFAINQLELPPGGEGPEHDHVEDGQEEVYAVVRGGGAVRIDGEPHELAPGRFVFVSPRHRRQLVAGDEGLVWIGIGSRPASD